MISFLKLVRYKNLLMVLLTLILTKYALINFFTKESYLTDFQFSILSLSLLLLTAAGYIINDVTDIEADKINKPEKVFIGVSISKNNAIIWYVVLNSIGLALGVYISYLKHFPEFSFYFLFIVVALYCYSKYLKKIALIGNVLIAILCGLVIYLVYIFDYRFDHDTVLSTFSGHELNHLKFGEAYILFFLRVSIATTLIREIIKDIEDIKGDYATNMKTLPILIGTKRSRNIIIALSVLLFMYVVLFCMLSFSLGFYIVFVGLLVIALITLVFIYKIWNAIDNYTFLSKFIKLIMLLGILSMLLFKFQ